MKKRVFGRTGWRVSPITFGAWQLGGTWGEVSEQQAIGTLLHAFDRGINMVDTAAAYGQGRSEELVGKALAMRPEQDIYLATKVLPLGIVMGEPALGSIQGQYPASYIKSEVESALRRLNRDYVDLLQLHLWIEDGYHNLDWLEGLADLMVEGKVRAIGVSLPDVAPKTGVALAKTGLVSSIQVMFNMFEQSPIEELFPAGEATNTAFIARVPMDSGALSGSWTTSTYSEWGEGDKRREMFRDERFAETISRVEELKVVCGPFFSTLSDAALNYCLSEPAVSTIACGMRSEAEVDANIDGMANTEFPQDLRVQLRDHAWKRNFYR